MRSVLMEPRGDWTRLADYPGVQRQGHMGGSSPGELTNDSVRLRYSSQDLALEALPDGKQFDGVYWMKQLPSEQSHHMSDTNETSEILKSPRLPTKKSLHLYQGHSGHICLHVDEFDSRHQIFPVLSLTRDRETTGLSGATALIWGARLVLAKHLLIWFVPSAWIGDSESRERSPAQSSSPEKFKLLGLALTVEEQIVLTALLKSHPVTRNTLKARTGLLSTTQVGKSRGSIGIRSDFWLAGMGNLLKVLTREIENYPHFFLDFENAQPTEGEREVWNQISAVLQDSESILADLQAYKGAGPEIRDAIQNPNDIQLQEKAWNAVCPLVVRLKRFYEFSIRLEKALQSLLESLTCPPYTPTQHLEREQALAKEFAEILHFTLRFDELKMRNPAIQNDFSYYRRTISRNRINNMHLDIENEVNNEMANRMSLFYAEATPMLKTLSNATMHFVSENKTLPIENTTDCLSTMTSVCKVMLETPEYRSRFTSEETLMFCMRVMVGVIILYDHVHPVGAFCKTSKIDMKGCIKVLKEQAPDSVEGLLNALRFTTKHLNDESTSKQIRAMLQ
ncbi:hypothetical protein MG293_003893 [Ovis ammon polii]|uniref:CYRIA/CYRIB Rac1 binding domain-containing protein n=1 Tax=Ovis ammon polii TaxID=230172 RepID=A0AAD4UHI7_OVIAM|nr:hypothetical protein MG293_003893 [Ovis ammon polii]